MTARLLLFLLPFLVSAQSFAELPPETAQQIFARDYVVETPEDDVADIFRFTVDQDLSVTYPDEDPMWHFDSITAVIIDGILPVMQVTATWQNDEWAQSTVFRFVIENDGYTATVKLLDVIELQNDLIEHESSARVLQNSRLR